MRTAATASALSARIVASTCSSARRVSSAGSSVENGLRYGYGAQKCTTPPMTLLGSLNQRRFSPVSVAEPVPDPWNERYAASTFARPVTTRANLIASSFADAPEVVKNTRPPSPPHGPRAISASPSSARTSLNQLGGLKHSRSTCACIAASTAGCEWPRFAAISDEVRSA
jgi:hypothetical protein